MKCEEAQAALALLADDSIAAHAQRFFKTGVGEYGEGDSFIGVRVPNLRRLAKEFRELAINEVRKLLRSGIHEERLLALLIMVLQFNAKDRGQRQQLYDVYMDNTDCINNWDLVDTSAPSIVGGYLFKQDRSPLLHMVRSDLLWDRRIAIISTLFFIRQGDLETTFELSSMLLNDREDLMHKATGWMLREAGKRDCSKLHQFLKRHYHRMPRTMLRYAIEKLSEPIRQTYLDGTA